MVGRGCSLGGSWLRSPKARGIPGEELLNILSVLFCVCVSAAPDGPPMDVTLQPITSQSIQVTWKVGEAGMVWELFLTVGDWLNSVPACPDTQHVIGVTRIRKNCPGKRKSWRLCKQLTLLLRALINHVLQQAHYLIGCPWGTMGQRG